MRGEGPARLWENTTSFGLPNVAYEIWSVDLKSRKDCKYNIMHYIEPTFHAFQIFFRST